MDFFLDFKYKIKKSICLELWWFYQRIYKLKTVPEQTTIVYKYMKKDNSLP